MRAADNWRALARKSFPLRLERLTYRGVAGLGEDDSLELRGGITVLCGANGAGKSTMLEALLGGVRVSDSPPRRLRLRGAALDVAIVRGGIEQHVRAEFDGAGDAVVTPTGGAPVVWLNPAEDAVRIRKTLAEMTHLDEVLEAHSPNETGDEDLELVRYVTGRHYDRHAVYELDELEDDGTPLPYFVVSAHGAEYGAELMGLGELSLNIALWHLQQLEREQIVLFEEPETFVSPRAQVHLLDALAEASVRKDLWMILTTHSPGIVQRVGLENVRLLFRERTSVRIIDTPSEMQLRETVGLEAVRSTILLVEDRNAAHALTALLRRLDPGLLATAEIVVTGDAAALSRALGFPEVRCVRLVGVFDADQAGTTGPVGRQLSFLPFAPTLESALRVAVARDLSVAAAALGMVVAEVGRMMAGLEGREDHDWIEGVVLGSARPHADVVDRLVGLWLDVEGNRRAAQNLVDELVPK